MKNLSGSAIVYDRNVDGNILTFGISGLLYDSNLLMYDKSTESLWSQSMGKGVVGEFNSVELDLVKSNLMSFTEFNNLYPNGKVLSDETGFSRNYGEVPYGDYDNNDVLYFPVQNEDLRFKKKELFYIVNDSGESIAFLLKDLREKGVGEIKVGENTYKASFKDGVVNIVLGDKVINGYYEMWFSWINHNVGNKNVWFSE